MVYIAVTTGFFSASNTSAGQAGSEVKIVAAIYHYMYVNFTLIPFLREFYCNAASLGTYTILYVLLSAGSKTVLIEIYPDKKACGIYYMHST